MTEKTFLNTSSTAIWLTGLIFGFVGMIGMLTTPTIAHANAADRATCKMLESLLEATEKGLAAAAEGAGGRTPTSGISVYAGEAQDMAESSPTDNFLPSDVLIALDQIVEAASQSSVVSDVVVVLLENGLTIQTAMATICPEAQIPDLARYSDQI